MGSVSRKKCASQCSRGSDAVLLAKGGEEDREHGREITEENLGEEKGVRATR